MTPTPDQPRLSYVACLSPAGVHRMAYWEWGDPDNDRVLMCVHGLTRNGRDFDRLAQRLAAHYRVVCPDVVGRGRSDWLAEPAYYVVPQYMADMATLMARLKARVLHWVGTSMGGMMGMMLAGMPGASAAGEPEAGPGQLMPPISRMVLNDIGPVVELSAISRIAEYVGLPVDFGSFEEAVTYIRTVSASFGPHSDDDWRELTRHVVRQEGERWVRHYDPGVAAPFAALTGARAKAGEAVVWRAYDAIACPMLVIRGGESDLLLPATVEAMLQRNPLASAVAVPRVGHAPTFMSDDQIDLVTDFLLQQG